MQLPATLESVGELVGSTEAPGRCLRRPKHARDEEPGGFLLEARDRGVGEVMYSPEHAIPACVCDPKVSDTGHEVIGDVAPGLFLLAVSAGLPRAQRESCPLGPGKVMRSSHNGEM